MRTCMLHIYYVRQGYSVHKFSIIKWNWHRLNVQIIVVRLGFMKMGNKENIFTDLVAFTLQTKILLPWLNYSVNSWHSRKMFRYLEKGFGVIQQLCGQNFAIFLPCVYSFYHEFLSHVYFDRDRHCQIQNFKNHQTLF